MPRLSLRRVWLLAAGLLAIIAMAVAAGSARADQQVSSIKIDAITPSAVAKIVRPNNTPISAMTFGRFEVRSPSGSENVFTGFCVDPEKQLMVGSNYDAVLSWDGRPTGGTDDLPALNNKRDELSWLLYNTEDLLDDSGGAIVNGVAARDARGAAIQALVWQQLGLAHPVTPIADDASGIVAQYNQVKAALDGRGENIAQGLGIATSTGQASVCGTTAGFTTTVFGTANSIATLEIEGEPSPQTARLLGAPGVSPAPDGRSATVRIGSGGSTSLQVTGSTPGQLKLKVSAKGVRLVHWRGLDGTSSVNMQPGVYALKGSFVQRATVTLTGCLPAPTPVAPVEQASTGFTPAAAPGPKAKVSFALRGPRVATAGKVVKYRLRIVNTSPRLVAQRIKLRYRIPLGLRLPPGQRWASAVTVRGRALTIDMGSMRPKAIQSFNLDLLVTAKVKGARKATAILWGQNISTLHRSVTTQVTPGKARVTTVAANRGKPAKPGVATSASASAWR